MQTHFSAEQLVDSAVAESEKILRSCVHCGFCTATCPTYQLTGDELDGPRGRIYLIKQLLEGNAVGRITQRHLDRCLSCRACETTCPYDAIAKVEEGGKELAAISKTACKGCGGCVPVCPFDAIDLQGYTDAQIRSMIDGMLEVVCA